MLSPSSTYSVAVNPWIICAAVLCLRFVLVGAAWVWILPFPQRCSHFWWARSAVRSAQAVVIGFVISVLVSLGLSEAGTCTLGIEILISVVLVVVGLVAGISIKRELLLKGLLQSFPGVVVFVSAIAAVMWLPKTSEWIPGGWDPGVYLNQGVWIGQTGTFYPEPESAYLELTESELTAFTRTGARGVGDYRECFPGVPLDCDTRSVRNYFYRLTPTAIGLVARCGGLRAATRVNFIMGFLACFVLAAFFLSEIEHPFCAIVSTAFLAAHPLFLYHLHITVSEMLQLFLVCCIALLLSIRASGWAAPFLLSLTVLAAVLNRISFMPFSAMLLPMVAWLDRDRSDRRRVRIERYLFISAIVLGGCFDAFVTGVTSEQLKGVVPTLILVAVGFALAAVILDEVVYRPQMKRFLQRLPTWLSPALCCTAIAIFLLAWLCRGIEFLQAASTSLRGILPYLGWGYVGTSVAGALVLFSRDRKDTRLLRIILCWLVAVGTVVTVQSQMTMIYPWATRRYLAFTVPSLAMLSGYLCYRLWSPGLIPSPWNKCIATVVLSVVLICTARMSWHAWNRTEYDGLSSALAEVAEQIAPDDIVVVDHPWWGTPLRFLHGVRVLNARPFYARDKEDTMSAGISALERLKQEGKTIRFLTSTERGLDVYPLDPGNVDLDWKSKPVILDRIIHHKRMSDFKIEHKTRIFQLYTWQGRST